MKKNIENNFLFDLLIIISVVFILFVFTYNQFSLAQKKSRDLQRRSDLHEFSKVIKLYFADYGKLPDDILVNNLWGKSFIDNGYVYAKSVPQEKYGNKQYCYQIYEDGISFKMFAEFENKNDSDCKKEKMLCNEIEYCYTDINYVNNLEK